MEASNTGGSGKVTRLMESERVFRSLFDYAPVGIVLRQVDGPMYETNLMLQRMLGYSAEELAKIKTAGVTHPDDREPAGSLLDRIVAEGLEGRQVEKRYIRKDGSVMWASVSASLVRDAQGKPEFAVGVIVDITDKKKIEEVSKIIEREREELLVKERQAREDAERMVKLRDDFLLIASHELRTPLAPLMMGNKLLKALVDAISPPTENKRQMLKTLDSNEQSLRRIERMVELILTTSRIDAGAFKILREPCDLSAVVRRTLDQYEVELLRSQCQLQLDLPAGIRGNWDSQRLGQAIGCLLENAMKYGRGRTIEIKADLIDQVGRVSIRDHGLGVAIENGGRIFERFERRFSVKHYGGFGLGLYVAKAIVESHQGHIRFESQPTEGTRFTIELPTHLIRPMRAKVLDNEI